MREATGELNMTLVVLSSVAILAAFFFMVLWPIINNGQKSQLDCNKAVCGKKVDGNGYVDCHIPNETDNFKCKYKG